MTLSMLRSTLLPAAALVLALAACSSKASDAAPVAAQQAALLHPQSGLPVIPVTVWRGTHRYTFQAELARTGREQAQGLMFRTAMGPDEGMLFPMNPPRTASFWMRNTVIPLDIIYVGTDGRILNIESGVPYNETPVASAGVVKAVLELNAGRSAALGIVPGDKVEWQDAGQ